jgi:hypothetical protein
MGAVIRTSALPKLAACPCFIGAGGSAGLYAARGTLADEAFRLANMGDTVPLDTLDDRIAALASSEEINLKPAAEGVRWALAKMQELAGEGVECITDEAELTVCVEGLDADSVADGNAPAAMVGFDLKTGNISNYLEQMAGYALGFMCKYFADEWTMHLLYMDKREVITHRFTHDEARNIVLGVRARALDPDRKAVLNAYCNWCALSDSCSTRTAAAQRALEYANGLNVREGLGDIVGNAAKLSAFLSAADCLKSFGQVASERARWMLEGGDDVPGWGLTQVYGIGHVTPEGALLHLKKLPKGEEMTIEKLIKALGHLTPHQFKAIMASVNKPLPKKWRSQGRAATYLTRVKKKTEF